MLTIILLLLLSVNTKDEIATYGKRLDDEYYEEEIELPDYFKGEL
ncbi:MAG: hypothetical protein SPH07_01500 [Eubacteriales bacterium]|nr:hypothetical protein [Eubacteriales bacterium]